MKQLKKIRRPLIERVAIDQNKLQSFLDQINLKMTPFFNSLYGSKNGRYLLEQMLSGEKIVSIKKYLEFQGKVYQKYGIIPNLLNN